MLPTSAFMYEATDVPEGMTLDDYRRRPNVSAVAPARSRREKPRRRKRVVWIPGIDLRSPLGSVLPAPRAA